MNDVSLPEPGHSASAERPIVFACAGAKLVGVLSPAPAELGVVVVVGGPQYRGGSHRQFVLLARHLAAAGFPVLRFDVRGMGDSEGEQRGFESVTPDIAAAVDTLCAQQPQVRRVVLWGLCDGASAALLYVHEKSDPRVQGLVLLNPWVRSQASLARTHVKHYYRQRLLQGDFWRKLLTGGVARSALGSLWQNLRLSRGGSGSSSGSSSAKNVGATVNFQQRMAAAWRGFPGHILLVLSGRDYTAREFQEFIRSDPAWAAAMARSKLTTHDAVDADHTFSATADRLALELVTARWLHSLG